MTAYVKHLPAGALPDGGVRTWGVREANRWLAARVPWYCAPAAGSWVLAGLVAVAFLLTGAREPAAFLGTGWGGTPAAVLLAALPLWFRWLPHLTLVSTAVLAVDAAVSLTASAAPGAAGLVGRCLVLSLCGGAATAAVARLRCRRVQRALVLAAAGTARHPLPAHLPAGPGRRRLRWVLTGSGLCAAAVAGAAAAASGPLGTQAVLGAQAVAVLLLAAGTTLAGRGLVIRRAARRLRAAPQPALVVGVRATASGRRHWLCPDADTRSARPLLPYAVRTRDTPTGARLLAGGAEAELRARHHDIDPRVEPFEAVLYGVACEGSEVVLEYAVYEGGSRIVSQITAVPLLPGHWHRLGWWQAAGESRTEAEARAKHLDSASAAGAARRARGVGAPAGRTATFRPRASVTRPATPSEGRRAADTSAGGCGGCGGGGGGGCGGCGCG